MESIAAYVPMDRRQALARGESLPERTQGAALFADISGFTPLTDALVHELGPQRGAEELAVYLNRVYDALVYELHRFGGSVLYFSGDAITCWLDGDSGLRAIACGLAMQAVMQPFGSIKTPSGSSISLAVKVAIAAGDARRFLVGDPEVQVIEVLSGSTLYLLAEAEHHTQKGEVVLDGTTASAKEDHIHISEWRSDEATGHHFAVIAGLADPVADSPWPVLAPADLKDEQLRPWLLAPIYERLRQGKGDFLAEIRPAVALFLRFGGIDYDHDENAVQKLNDFVCHIQHILSRYDGQLIQLTIGDKGSYLYAAFGAPVAHEDDAVRAAFAALELRAAAASQESISELQIGISKGRMRTGAYGGAASRSYGVLGEATNLSARLMQAAAPNQILASKLVFKDATDSFDWEQLPDIRVKGKSSPVSIFNLRGLSVQSPGRMQDDLYKLPMVGRKAELDLIQEKIELVRQGKGQIVGITGEAGMGKSRLTGEIVRLATSLRMENFGGECQSYGTNTSYMVWQNIWRAFFGLQADWNPEEQIRGLEVMLSLINPSLLERLPLLSTVLNIPIPENDLTRSLDAKIRKSSAESLLVDCIRARAQEFPLVFVFEDAQWLDPLSRDLLEEVVRAIANLPVMLLINYRPFNLERLKKPSLEKLPYFTEIELKYFSEEEAGTLLRLKVSQLFGPQVELPETVSHRLVARSEGNPFYLEELLNYLQDAGLHPDDVKAFEKLDLPASLHSLILSRIDQLNEGQKITLKVASVIGRIFRAAMLWGAYSQLGDEHQILADLDVLSRVELTIRDSDPELTYFFKHMITQEVAYESLPYATRSILHQQIGNYLEDSYSSNLKQVVDLLAFHFSRSEELDKKQKYLLMAGEVAQANYNNAAAMDYYQRVLPLLADEERAQVHLKLGQVLVIVGQWKEAIRLYRETMQKAALQDDCALVGRCQAAMGEIFRKQGRYLNANRWLRFAGESFERVGDESGIAQVLNSSGSLSAQQGDYQKARDYYEKSLAIWRRLGDKARIASGLSNLGIVARFLGEYEKSRALHQEGLALRRELGDRWGIAVSLNNLGNVELDLGNLNGARARLEESTALQREIGDKYYIANSLSNLGNVTLAQGDYPDARRLYRESLRIIRELGDRWTTAYLLEYFGCLACQQGQYELAIRMVAAASSLREAIHAPLSNAEQEKLDHLLAPARQALDKKDLDGLWKAGKSLPLPHAIEEALNEV